MDCENCRHLTVVGLHDSGPCLDIDPTPTVAFTANVVTTTTATTTTTTTTRNNLKHLPQLKAFPNFLLCASSFSMIVKQTTGQVRSSKDDNCHSVMRWVLPGLRPLHRHPDHRRPSETDEFSLFYYPSLLLTWMFEHDCLDTCCFGCLKCMGFVFLYLHLFSAVDNVSRGKAL